MFDWRHWFKEEHHGYDYHKTKIGKVWHFLAHDESIWSFLVDAILVVVIGKFVILPLLGLALGTSFPLVAVVSSSMEHHGSFDSWWAEHGQWYEEQNISREQFLAFPHTGGFNKGDVFAVRGVRVSDIKVGDIIVYSIPGQSDPIIHRVVKIADSKIETKGDANMGQLGFEFELKDSQIKGEAVTRIPFIGWVKVAFVELMAAFKK